MDNQRIEGTISEMLASELEVLKITENRYSGIPTIRKAMQVTYAMQTHVMPLVERGLIKMSIPDKPKSPKQLFYSK